MYFVLKKTSSLTVQKRTSETRISGIRWRMMIALEHLCR